MVDKFDVISVIVAAYKDYEQAQALDKIKKAYWELAAADADGRRDTQSAIIKTIAKLKAKLCAFKMEYERLCKKHGNSVSAIEKYIKQIEAEIKRLSEEKNKRR